MECSKDIWKIWRRRNKIKRNETKEKQSYLNKEKNLAFFNKMCKKTFKKPNSFQNNLEFKNCEINNKNFEIKNFLSNKTNKSHQHVLNDLFNINKCPRYFPILSSLCFCGSFFALIYFGSFHFHSFSTIEVEFRQNGFIYRDLWTEHVLADNFES